MINGNKIDNTQEFFRSIFRSNPFIGKLEYRAIKDDNVHQKFISMFDEHPNEELKSLNDEGYNIYFGVGSRNKDSGGKASVWEIPSLWVDFDLKPGESRSDLKKRLDLTIEDVGMEPTLTTDSGNGYQLYFVLIDFVFIKSKRDIQMVESKLRWLASEFDGDNVCDIPRVMRVPGFNNMKDPKNPKPCKVVEFNPSQRYKLSDFGDIPVDNGTLAEVTIGVIPDEISDRFIEMRKTDKSLNETFLGQRDDLSDSSGSGYDMSLANKLVRRGFSNEEIAKIMKEAPYEKKSPRTKAYLEHTIAKARAGYCEPCELVEEQNGLAGLSLMPGDFDDSNVEYLIDGFLPKDTLMLLTGSYGVGKSYFTLALTKRLIKDGKTVAIVDVDMPKHIIHQRLEGAGLLEQLGNKLHYIHSTNFPFKIDSKNTNWCEFKKRIEIENNAVLILDNLKELFRSGEDLNVDSNVIPVMNELKEVRDMHNTVILIHHIGKDSSSNHPFKNSGSIADSVDVAYYLERKGDECILRNFKSRVPVDDKVKFLIEPDDLPPKN